MDEEGGGIRVGGSKGGMVVGVGTGVGRGEDGNNITIING
jgi:hypothetical protein